MHGYAMITGAAGGFGKALAAECASRGWDLFLTDIDPVKLAALEDDLAARYGVNTRSFACDMTEPDSRKLLWEYVQENSLQFHMLINVAGVEYEGPFEDRTLTQLRTMVRLHVEAVAENTRSVLAFRHPAYPLRVINISSLAGFNPMPIKSVYSSTKRFIIQFTLALREEFPVDEAAFTVVAPAGMPTSERAIQGIKAQGLMGRLTAMPAEEVARRSIDQALAGKALYIPGIINRAVRFLTSLLPETVMAKLIGMHWKKAYQKRKPEAGAARVIK
jgi:short-subunit dehydrogenase